MWLFSRWWHRKTLDREMEAELSFHRQAQIEDYMAEGCSREDAIRRVRLDFGSDDAVKEECRDVRGVRLLEDLQQDVRYAFRGMRRNPGFTAVALLSLTLGIGANSAVYSVVDHALLRSLPVPRPQELVLLKVNGTADDPRRLSNPLFEQLRDSAAGLSNVAAMSSSNMFSASVPGSPAEMVRGQLVSGEWFDLLGAKPAVGRLVEPSDNRSPGAHPVVVLSNGFWHRRFGGDPGVAGSTLTISGVPFTVIGVAPQAFSGVIVGEEPDLWMPIMMQQPVRHAGNASIENADGKKPWVTQAGIRWLYVIARLPGGWSGPVKDRLQAAFHREMEAEAKGLTQPMAKAVIERLTLGEESVARGLSFQRKVLEQPLWVLLATSATILLISCANLANLLLARGRARRREIAARLAIGAGRGRVLRQLLTESLLLALLGGAAGLWMANWGSYALLRLSSSGEPSLRLFAGVDGRVVLFTLAITAITGILFGLGPALRATRADTGPELRVEARGIEGGPGSGRYVWGKLLVAMQVAFSLLLVTGAVLFVRTLQNLASVDPGFRQQSLLTARIDLRAAGYREDRLPDIRDRLLQRVRAIPGVQSASLSLYSLASGSARVSGIVVSGRVVSPDQNVDAQENYVASDYLATTGIALLRGRDFTRLDQLKSPLVAIVNEAFVRKFLPGESAVGRTFGFGESEPAVVQIVGVVRDVRINNLREPPPALVLYPLAQHPDEYFRSIDVRASGDPDLLANAIRKAIAEVDRNVPIREIASISDQVNRTMTAERLVARLTTLFGAIALGLVCLGLFGVMSYTTARRRGEIAIRMALGATQREVLGMILGESLLIVVAGTAAGLALTYAVTRIVQGLLYGLAPSDPVSFGLAAGLLVISGSVAGWLPAWRASRIDPIAALRYE